MRKLRLLLGLALAAILPAQLTANPALLPTIATYAATAAWLADYYAGVPDPVTESYWNGSEAGMNDAASLIGLGYSTPAQFYAVADAKRAQAALWAGFPATQAHFHGAADALESVGIWIIFPP